MEKTRPWSETENEVVIDMFKNVPTTNAEEFVAMYQQRTGVTRTAGALGVILRALMMVPAAGIAKTKELLELQRSIGRLSAKQSDQRKDLRRQLAEVGHVPKVRRVIEPKGVRRVIDPTGLEAGRYMSSKALAAILTGKVLPTGVHAFCQRHNVTCKKIGNLGYYSIDDLSKMFSKLLTEAQETADYWQNCLTKTKATPKEAPKTRFNGNDDIVDTILAAAARGDLTSQQTAKALEMLRR